MGESTSLPSEAGFAPRAAPVGLARLLGSALALAPFASAMSASASTAETVSATAEMEEPGYVAGPYSSYAAACRKAKYLKDCGYCVTSIKYSASKCCYHVYYH